MPTTFEIDGKPVTDPHRYALRWHAEGGTFKAELYCDGRRVTKPWRLVLDVRVPEDEHGASA